MKNYIICILLIFSGVFCGISLIREATATSYINGELDIQNQFTVRSFSYVSNNVNFYNDGYSDVYEFSEELLKVEDFNGLTKNYQIILNNFILFETETTAGSIYAAVNIDFHNTNNEIICSSVFEIYIKFLNNRTTLKFSTTGAESASFLEQYFTDNGIRLKINEIGGNND